MTSRNSAQFACLRLYLFAWIGYFALLVLLPVRYGNLEGTTVALALSFWIAVSGLAAVAMHYALLKHRVLSRVLSMPQERPLLRTDLVRLILVSVGLSFAGLIALSFDRVMVQGVDFSQGIAVARQLWRESGEARTGVSSIFSVAGYLLGFTYFVATTLAHLHWEALSARLRLFVVLAAIVLTLGHSLLTGGRSVLLVQLAAVAATGALRANLGRPMLPGRGLRIWLAAAVVAILAIGYAIYVFVARASAVGSLPELYALGMLAYLGAEPSEGFFRLSGLPSSLAGTLQLGVVAGAYLTHSFGTFESVLEMQLTPSSVSFGLLRELLARLGLADSISVEWVLSGRFLSLPGSLWYDFGWAGFYAGAAVVGGLLGLVPWLIRISAGGVSLCIAVLIMVTVLLAPLVIAFDLLCAPFVILGFLLMHSLYRLSKGPANWSVVGIPVASASREAAI